MELAIWWALFLGLALVAGLMFGLVWRVLIANRGLSLARVFTIAVIALFGAINILLIGGPIVDELLDSGWTGIAFLLPPAFAITWLVGFRSVVRHRTPARIRERRRVAVSGSHEVTHFLRETVGGSGTTPTGPATMPPPTPLLVDHRNATKPVTLQPGVQHLTLPPPRPPGS